MEHRVIERTAELAAAMEHAQEADQIKSAFLATIVSRTPNALKFNYWLYWYSVTRPPRSS